MKISSNRKKSTPDLQTRIKKHLIKVRYPEADKTHEFFIKNFNQEQRQSKYTMDWLRGALQIAAELEFFTIPPYLYALWSIEDQTNYMAYTIRDIAMEEMQHLGMVCNMMKAIGAVPDLTSIDRFPRYPAQLPGINNDQLDITLSPFSKESAFTFMEIEKPADYNKRGEYNTIGKLYDDIAEAFKTLQPELELTGQITGPRAPAAMSSITQVCEAIEIIKEQGEGSSHTESPNDPDGGLAHYYSFGECHHEKKYDRVEKDWVGPKIVFPEVFKIHTVPEDGFERKELGRSTVKLLDRFNFIFTDMVNGLETSWRTGQYPYFMGALEKMFELQEIARELMENHRFKEKWVGPEFKRSTGYNIKG